MSDQQTPVAHDGRPLYINGKSLRGLLMAKHSSALTTVRRALAGGKGVYAAAKLLDVGMTTLNRAATEWPELYDLLRAGAMPAEKRCKKAGRASAKARKK